MSMWVVRRTYDQLAELPLDERPSPHPDRSIVVPAMAEYIRFTGKQIAMPTIWFNGQQEYLRDGAQLLQALRLVGRADEVFCLWLSEVKLAAPRGGEPFSAVWEQRTGSDARLLTFNSPPDAAQQNLLRVAWGMPPRKVSELSWGWGEQEAASLPDWLTWMRAVAKLLPRLPLVVAVNGRRTVFPAQVIP
jgi:hypothetical protein